MELWSSIRRSPGFSAGFPAWWLTHRQLDVPDAPLSLPTSPPRYLVAQAIFLSFKSSYEAFESWHLRQRSGLLRKKYLKSWFCYN